MNENKTIAVVFIAIIIIVIIAVLSVIGRKAEDTLINKETSMPAQPRTVVISPTTNQTAPTQPRTVVISPITNQSTTVRESVPSSQIDSTTKEYKPAFTNGLLKSDCYENNWADLRFTLPPGFTAQMESGQFFAVNAEIKTSVLISFMDLSAEKAKKYFLTNVDEFLSQYSEEIAKDGATVVNHTVGKIDIAGKEYFLLKIDERDPEGINYYQWLCIRTIEDKTITIWLSGYNEDNINALLYYFAKM